MKRAVVIGAGISGLAVARAMRDRGFSVTVFESQRTAGGKIATVREGGFTCESGPASFLDGDPAMTRVVDDASLRERLVSATEVARMRLVAVGNGMHEVPESAASFVATRALPPGAKFRVLADLVLPRGPAGSGLEESVMAFGRRRLGRVAAERILYPIVSGIYAFDAATASLPSTFPWLAAMERDHRSLVWGAWRHRQQMQLSTGGRLVTFASGMQELTDALARHLGADLHLGCPVRSVAKTAHGIAVVVEGQGGTTEVPGDVVVLAVPAHAAAPLVRCFDAGLADVLCRIPYAPVVLAHLGFDGASFPRAPAGYGFLVPPGEKLSALGGIFTSAVFPGRAPEGAALVTVRLGGERHREHLALTDEELVALACADLTACGLVTGRPIFARVVRHQQGLPAYVLGHAERVREVEKAERRHGRVYFTGNAYRGLGIVECVRDADAVAQRAACDAT